MTRLFLPSFAKPARVLALGALAGALQANACRERLGTGSRPPETAALLSDQTRADVAARRCLTDSDTGGSEADFAAFRLDTARIDIALFPLWMATSAKGQRVIDRWIKPRQVIAMHVGTHQVESAQRDVAAAVRGARVFTRSLERLT